MASFRSVTPEPASPMAGSLYKATTTIDDLTIALSNYSRIPSPEPSGIVPCCCGTEYCECSRGWHAFKQKLESRLILSAEVGQALLERHEAYVRRHERNSQPSQDMEEPVEGHIDARVADLVRANAVLEKRLNQTLVNSEVAEMSNKTALQELQDARATITRLTAHNARAIGLETRLSTALQERDDIQQERDSATQRAKMAESRLLGLNQKYSKLQAQNNRLREDLEMQRVHRHELSEEVLADARQRLEQLQHSQFGHSLMIEDAEVTKVLASLVADNEALKRDNAELQNLLTESREDLKTLQEEVDERRASDVSYSAGRHRYTNSLRSNHSTISPLSPSFHIGTAPAPSQMHPRTPSRNIGSSSRSDHRRAASVEPGSRHTFEPLTPDTDRRPVSPTESLTHSELKWSSFSHQRPNYTPSHLSLEVDEENQRSTRPASLERSRAPRALLLQSREKGVQTDARLNGVAFSPSPMPRGFGDSSSSLSPHDGQSDSSSLTDGQSSVIGVVVERVTVLLARIIQADALTLTNRLKRQHLQGADISHLSRATVNSILHEAATLRAHFRAFLEDERVTTTCTRKDLRVLFNLMKDIFTELGQMRVTLNDVILDPSVALKVSEMALNPSKAEAATRNVESPSNAPSGSWMAPLTKLLGLPTTVSGENAASRALSPPIRTASRGRGRPPPRIVPKREAALSASAMTVNVEFSGAGVGRAVTSTFSAHPDGRFEVPTRPRLEGQSGSSPAPSQNATRSVMDIFAGAPRGGSDAADPWIVIPTPQRAVTVPIDAINESIPSSGSATIGRSMLRKRTSRLSRVVDAVIDQQQSQQGEHNKEKRDTVQDTLLERTLRPRGLSDSSIHTTFMNHEDQPPQAESTPFGLGPHPDRGSVLQTLTRRMQSFRFASSSSLTEPRVLPDSRPRTANGLVSRSRTQNDPGVMGEGSQLRSASPGILSSWATALDPTTASTPYYVGSPRDEFGGTWSRARDY